MITGYVPGGFDMLHVGHLNILTEAAKRRGLPVEDVAPAALLRARKGEGAGGRGGKRRGIRERLREGDSLRSD